MLIALLGVALLVFFGLWALLSPVLAGGGPLSGCVSACPENVLQIGSAPELVAVAGTARPMWGSRSPSACSSCTPGGSAARAAPSAAR